MRAKYRDLSPVRIQYACDYELTAISRVVNAAFELETFLVGPRTHEKALRMMMKKEDSSSQRILRTELSLRCTLNYAVNAAISVCWRLIPRSRASAWGS